MFYFLVLLLLLLLFNHSLKKHFSFNLESDNKKGQGLLWSVQAPEHTMIKREENIEFDRIHELEERLRRARNSRLNSFRNDPEADRNITQNISGK